MLRNLCDFARSGPNWPESRLWQGIQADVAWSPAGTPFTTSKVPDGPDVAGATMLGTAPIAPPGHLARYPAGHIRPR
ncbi:hypothetical protein CBM2623_A320070 [Cupriavidus taiwanensis]|nr:hypothetical protein CBM2608_A320070 [Cupriavidus taiwanensis]SPA29369.1 hypothetical protein CBM2623_A320070 [Cupriavidus taiwanensis]SPA45991.1 hypothetical protein CBM2629_A290073 [Cupriavidus taiwanensis]